MKCIICGKGSGTQLYCSSYCSNSYYKRNRIRNPRYILENLLQIRLQITKMYDRELHKSTDTLSDRESDLYDMLSTDIGLDKLANVLRKEFDDTQKTTKEISIRSI
jgi:hypothetical protein